LICEPDREACERIREVILKKYDKSTMKSLLRSQGQGILLVGVYTPLTSPEEIIEQAGNSIRAEITGLNSIFRSIYFYQNTESGHSFTELL
jgi:benzoyl-CoA reductase/2-hydroxyglutaryl-CoA dehydratase subunit BcrC/BadD/HgdB